MAATAKETELAEVWLCSHPSFLSWTGNLLLAWAEVPLSAPRARAVALATARDTDLHMASRGEAHPLWQKGDCAATRAEQARL